MKRRKFLKQTAWSAAALSTATWIAACNNTSTSSTETEPPIKMKELQLSLAQWSLHRQLFDKKIKAEDFAAITKEKYDINAVEYVNQFYVDQVNDEKFWLDMKQRAHSVGVTSLLIMIDEEGDLGVADDAVRKQSVENHFKWVDAAKLMDCHSIRVNAFGDEDRLTFKNALIDGMGQLATYAAKENINVVIENHGLYSSDAPLICEVVNQVNMENFGTFPDFGNWCTSAKWGSTMKECEKVYDHYQGVKEFLPFAKAVSAKSYEFEEDGSHPLIDYRKMLQIVKDSDYDGFIGIEYEGSRLSEHEGILATKTLMEKVWTELI